MDIYRYKISLSADEAETNHNGYPIVHFKGNRMVAKDFEFTFGYTKKLGLDDVLDHIRGTKGVIGISSNFPSSVEVEDDNLIDEDEFRPYYNLLSFNPLNRDVM